MARGKKKVQNHYQKVALILAVVLLFFTFIVGLSNAPFPQAGPNPWDPNVMGGPGGVTGSITPGITPNYINPSFYLDMMTRYFTGFNTVAPQNNVCVSDNQSCNNGM